MNFSSKTIIYLLLYFLLSTLLSFWAGNISFIIGGLVYPFILILMSLFVDQDNKLNFLKITSGFLLFYGAFLGASHFIFIENPFNDYYVNIDETGYYQYAVALSDLNLLELWQAAFTEFKYSGSPLFYAWMGSLQKVISLDSDFYSLLFQKLNVAFLGSFVPGIVYLLCRRITDQKGALKAALTYGLFSFAFFYSVTLMRDIHIALIYVLGFYIITGNEYNLKNYILLVGLGIVAYYIRAENGLFFLAFLGIWLYKSGSNRKIMIASASIAGIVAVVLSLGGIDTIYNMAFSTVENYRERGLSRAGQGSLGVQLMTLPAPINYVGMSAFGQISPFPFWFVFRNGILTLKVIFYLPEAIAGLFWFLVWVRIVLHPQKALPFFKQYKWAVVLSFLYIFVVSMGQPGARRLMAVYPIIFMGYMYINKKVFRAKEMLVGSAIYSMLLIIYWILKL